MIKKHISNQSVACYFREITLKEVEVNSYNCQGKWVFDWSIPFEFSYKVFALVTKEYPDQVQGLIALKTNTDPDFLNVEVNLIETAPQNKWRKEELPLYKYVGKCLVAFACQYSIEEGLDGFISLKSKTSSIDFYIKIGGFKVFGNNFIFDEHAATRLSKEHFGGGKINWLI